MLKTDGQANFWTLLSFSFYGNILTANLKVSSTYSLLLTLISISWIPRRKPDASI